jgi:hypothetical protein
VRGQRQEFFNGPFDRSGFMVVASRDVKDIEDDLFVGVGVSHMVDAELRSIDSVPLAGLAV